MKNFKYITLVILSLLCLFSCEKVTEDIETTTTEKVTEQIETTTHEITEHIADLNFTVEIGESEYEEDVITQINCYDHVIKCDPPLTYTDRFFCTVENESDGSFIVGTVAVENIPARWFYITPYNVAYMDNAPLTDGYEIRFYYEDGEIMYQKVSYQYLYTIQAFDLFAEAFISDEDFYMEIGTIKDDDGKIICNVSEILNVGEWYHSDYFYFKNQRAESKAADIYEFIGIIKSRTIIDKVIYGENEPPLMRLGITCAVPDFLNEEQIDVYRRAVTIFPVFSGVPDAIEKFPSDELIFERDMIEKGTTRYFKSTGRYRQWGDFEAMLLSVFTKEYFETLSEYFLNIDGQLYYPDAAAGGQLGYAPELKPDTFELISKTDTKIEFNLIGYYYEDGYAILENRGEIRTQTFPIIMEYTDDGWRFALFNKAS